MEITNKVYGDSKLFQKDYAQFKVESLIDIVLDLLPDVQLKAQERKLGVRYRDLVESYANLYNRTSFVVGDWERRYKVTQADVKDPVLLCVKIESYVKRLLDKGLFRIGQEEVILQ